MQLYLNPTRKCIKMALKFAVKSEKHAKFKFCFKPAIKKVNTRLMIEKYYYVRGNHTRFARSPISLLTKLLNLHHRKKK